MKKELLINFFISLFILPLMYVSLHLKKLIYKDYSEYDIHYSNLFDYLKALLKDFYLFGALFLILNLIPFTFIKYFIFQKWGKTYLKELILYTTYNCIFVLISGWGILFYDNPWTPSGFFILYIVFFSFIITSIKSLILNKIQPPNRSY